MRPFVTQSLDDGAVGEKKESNSSAPSKLNTKKILMNMMLLSEFVLQILYKAIDFFISDSLHLCLPKFSLDFPKGWSCKQGVIKCPINEKNEPCSVVLSRLFNTLCHGKFSTLFNKQKDKIR